MQRPRPLRAAADWLAMHLPDNKYFEWTAQWASQRLSAKLNREQPGRLAVVVPPQPAIVATPTVARHSSVQSADLQRSAALFQMWQADPYDSNPYRIVELSSMEGSRVFDLALKTSEGHRVSVNLETGVVFVTNGRYAIPLTRLTSENMGLGRPLEIKDANIIEQAAHARLGTSPEGRPTTEELVSRATVSRKTTIEQVRGSQYFFLGNPIDFGNGSTGQLGVNTSTERMFVQLDVHSAVVFHPHLELQSLADERGQPSVAAIARAMMSMLDVNDQTTIVTLAHVFDTVGSTDPTFLASNVSPPLAPVVSR